MTTQLLRDLLNDGATAWNAWRAQNPQAYIDLTHTNLAGYDLSGFDLQFADFSGSNLQGAKFINADLSFALFVRTDLRQTCFEGTNLYGVNLQSALVEGQSFVAESRP